MNKEQFQAEMLYQTTMSAVRTMLKNGLITTQEYKQIDTIFLKKYNPDLGTLFSDIRLT